MQGTAERRALTKPRGWGRIRPRHVHGTDDRDSDREDSIIALQITYINNIRRTIIATQHGSDQIAAAHALAIYQCHGYLRHIHAQNKAAQRAMSRKNSERMVTQTISAVFFAHSNEHRESRAADYRQKEKGDASDSFPLLPELVMSLFPLPNEHRQVTQQVSTEREGDASGSVEKSQMLAKPHRSVNS